MSNYRYFNPNPSELDVGDCVIRALCKALDKTWAEVYVGLCVQGFIMHNLPNADAVWGEYLRSHNFSKRIIPNTCPDCYTLGEFARDNPYGTYVIGTGTHAVTVKDGVIYDSWRSDDVVPAFQYYKKEGY